ncbi:MAG: hypothetical protein PVH61_26185 [Candidatus Aminicenantes bacterium]|jgi:hypothetical protein
MSTNPTHRPLESLKETANQLAHLITTNSRDKERIKALEQKLKPNRSDSNTRIPQAPNITETNLENPGQDGRVGIWMPMEKDGNTYYLRDANYQHEFDHWANVHEIPPKGTRKRVVYLGESVARGFLLDPFYTPAGVLETLLNSEPGLLQAEVVDLARTSCTTRMLIQLCSACLALKPDALVVFAGNNWWYSLDIPADILEEIVKIVERKGKFQDVKAMLDSQVKTVAITVMEHLNKISKAYQVPVVFVIPEFNLKDYQISPGHREMAWLQGEADQWYHLKKRSEAALDQGNIEMVQSLLHEMIQLNPGNPLSFELLGRCKLKQGLFSEAVEYLRAALDNAIYSGLSVPSCISAIRRTILEAAAKYNIPVVDLPEIFNPHQTGMPPGRELFLDYCHLTVAGIQIAMASTAQRLFSILTHREIPMEELKKNVPKPDDNVRGLAHFFAALHNAHRGDQPFEILYYHCLQALNTSLETREIMENFVEIASHHTLWHLNKNHEKLIARRVHKQYPYLYQPRNLYIMDLQLVEAIVSALKKHGTDIEEHVLQLRKKEFGLVNERVNLLESYYHLTSYDIPFPESNIGYYRAFSFQSRFFLVTQKDNDILLKLVYRVPGLNHHNEKVLFKINNVLEEELSPSNQWKETCLKVQGKLLKDGINRITLEWPLNMKFNRKLNEGLSADHRWELIDEIAYPVRGEIYMFTAEPVSASPGPG